VSAGSVVGGSHVGVQGKDSASPIHDVERVHGVKAIDRAARSTRAQVLAVTALGVTVVDPRPEARVELMAADVALGSNTAQRATGQVCGAHGQITPSGPGRSNVDALTVSDVPRRNLGPPAPERVIGRWLSGTRARRNLQGHGSSTGAGLPPRLGSSKAVIVRIRQWSPTHSQTSESLSPSREGGWS